MVQYTFLFLQVTLPVSTQIEIAPQHHQFMIGRGGLNIKQIMQGTGATIHFPDPNNAQRKSSVFVSGSIDSVVVARHLLMVSLLGLKSIWYIIQKLEPSFDR